MRWWSELECPHRRRTASEWGVTLLGKGSSGPRTTAAGIPGHLHSMVRGGLRCQSLLLLTSDQSVPPTKISRGRSDEPGRGLELRAGAVYSLVELLT